jgi:hypothetical protein
MFSTLTLLRQGSTCGVVMAAALRLLFFVQADITTSKVGYHMP